MAFHDVFGYPGTVPSPSSADIRSPGLRVPGAWRPAPRWYTARDLFEGGTFCSCLRTLSLAQSTYPFCCPSSVLATQLQLLKASLGKVLRGRFCEEEKPSSGQQCCSIPQMNPAISSPIGVHLPDCLESCPCWVPPSSNDPGSVVGRNRLPIAE